jgi:hypothetical protein
MAKSKKKPMEKTQTKVHEIKEKIAAAKENNAAKVQELFKKQNNILLK